LCFSYADGMHYYMQTELQTHCKSIKIKEGKQWKKEDACLAQYDLDKNWYRAKIIKNMGDKLKVTNSFYVTHAIIVFTIIFKHMFYIM